MHLYNSLQLILDFSSNKLVWALNLPFVPILCYCNPHLLWLCNRLSKVLVRSLSFSSFLFLFLYSSYYFFYYYYSQENFNLCSPTQFTVVLHLFSRAGQIYCAVCFSAHWHISNVHGCQGSPATIIYFALIYLWLHCFCFYIHKHTAESRISLSGCSWWTLGIRQSFNCCISSTFITNNYWNINHRLGHHYNLT